MSENTNNETNAATEATEMTKEKMWAEFQTEEYKIEKPVADEIEALTGQLYDLCEKHGVPLICLTNHSVEGKDVDFVLSQTYKQHKRVPKLFAIASAILARPWLYNDVADELLEAVETIGDREAAKLDPFSLLMARLGL